MKRLADFRKQVIEGWTVQRIAAVLIVVGLVVFVFGAVSQYCVCAGWPSLGDVLNHMIGDFYANVSVDCLSIAFAILVIDRLNERRTEQELKAQLIRELRSKDNAIALRALRELEARGWTKDGSLRRASLFGAHLEGASFQGADLQGADLRSANLSSASFWGANLQGADFSEAVTEETIFRFVNLRDAKIEDWQLAGAEQLCGAIMPNGSKYDGRFASGISNMEINFARLSGVHTEDPAAMARYYDVSIETYVEGQAWAHEHLQRIRYIAGIDLKSGTLPLAKQKRVPKRVMRYLRESLYDSSGIAPSPNDSKSQPADAPAQPAPRRNGHKASMVTHRVRR